MILDRFDASPGSLIEQRSIASDLARIASLGEVLRYGMTVEDYCKRTGLSGGSRRPISEDSDFDR